jgi:hypothetical protein
MGWKDRTASGRKRAILIDERTKDWRVLNGRLQFDGTSISQVIHAITTKLGTIPGFPEYGSQLRKGWQVLDVDMRELQASLVSALEPLEDAGVVKAGSARVEVVAQGGYVVAIKVEWIDGGGPKQTVTIPIQPGYYS